MIETRAIVDHIDDESVRLLMTPGATCAPCTEGRGCGAALWARKRVLTLPRQAVPKDTVRGSHVSVRWTAAMTGYGSPLAGLLAGASIASLSGAGDGLTALCGVAGVFLATVVVRILTRGSQRSSLVIE